MWHPEHLYDSDGHLDEGVIHAWLDGELGRDGAREVEAHATACPTCSARVEEARGLVAGASRILGALDEGTGNVAGGVAAAADAQDLPATPLRLVRGSSTAGTGPGTGSRGRWSTRRLAIAAAAVFVLAAGSVVLRQQGSDGVREAIVADRQPAPVAEAAKGVAARGNADAAATASATAVAEPVEPPVGPEITAPFAAPSPPPEVAAPFAAPSPAPAASRTAGAPAASTSLAGAEKAEPRAGIGAVAAAAAPPLPSAAAGSSWTMASAPEVERQRSVAQRTVLDARAQKAEADAARDSLCWRLVDATILLQLDAAAAPEGDGWRLGERVSGSKAEPIRWREEIGTAGRRFRIAEPTALDREGLLLRVEGDSLFAMPPSPGSPVGPLRGVRVGCP